MAHLINELGLLSGEISLPSPNRSTSHKWRFGEIVNFVIVREICCGIISHWFKFAVVSNFRDHFWRSLDITKVGHLCHMTFQISQHVLILHEKNVFPVSQWPPTVHMVKVISPKEVLFQEHLEKCVEILVKFVGPVHPVKVEERNQNIFRVT